MEGKTNTHTVFITGAAGYVGAMLVSAWQARDDVGRIIALDMEEPEEFVQNLPKVEWIKANTSDDSWQEQVRKEEPTIVIHAAWQIRNIYGDEKLQWKWNIEGSKKVFDFAFSTSSVGQLVYFSSAAILGADPNNKIEERFDENAPLRDEVYLYAYEKKKVEEMLRERAENKPENLPIAIVRPAAIAGPRGTHMRVRFGLQSALTGKLKGSFAYTIVSTLTTFVPATKKWCRQFVHEDDVVDIITRLAFEGKEGCQIYNLAPPGDVVLAKDMAKATGKKLIILPPWLIRIAFFFARHFSFGKIPTAAGAWRFYSFPIVMDGKKVTKELGHEYAYDSKEAFSSTRGRYEYTAPKEART
ncbi:MAG: NAD-dependent epimerase/dehydratase family protein [Candidatus Paceibacterota bacterium]